MSADLHQRGWEAWGYHFVWSQLLDSQFAWERMLSVGMVPPLAPVQSWVVYPPHPYKTGTNYHLPDSDEGFLLALSWAPDGNTTRKVEPHWETIYRSALAGQAITPEAQAVLSELGLLGPDGTAHVPVIRAENPLYDRLRSLATRLVEAISDAVPRDEITGIVEREPDLAFAMAYHDTGWELLRLLTERGTIARPAALTNPEATSMIGTVAIVAGFPPFLEPLGIAAVPVP